MRLRPYVEVPAYSEYLLIGVVVRGVTVVGVEAFNRGAGLVVLGVVGGFWLEPDPPSRSFWASAPRRSVVAFVVRLVLVTAVVAAIAALLALG